jgi:protein-S-isoprenylcysteine O-methyltransferase Ste14
MGMTLAIESKLLLIVVGLSAGGSMLVMLLWSIVHPERRFWPPDNATMAIKFFVWGMTILIFATAFFLGVLDWNRFQLPASLRWGVGLPLIVLGNLVVWGGVHKIGMAATSGEATGLRTDGLYHWSRNPQYVADITILIGWVVLAASLWVLPVIAVGLAVLIVAPIAEEPWLKESYGQAYETYKSTVRRYL